jgi:UDP-N-acetylmuramate--alanine ligase
MTHVHLIGIGGTGISSIARVLLEKGYTVSGSDRVLSSLAVDLRTSGVTVFEGHSASNINGADIVVRSSAIPDDNVEVKEAHLKGIPVLKRSDFLGSLMSQNFGIAIAGSHGKTTTSAMMAWALTYFGEDPSYILGGVSKNLKNNAHAGKGSQFVIEADEYDRMFLGLQPDVILLTNIGYDHPDCFPTPKDYEDAFRQFIQRLKPGGILVINSSDESRLSLSKSNVGAKGLLTYGLDSSAMFKASNLKVNARGGYTFDVMVKNETVTSIELAVPGEHNVLNLLGVFAVLYQLGYSPVKIASGLNAFEGTGRRFEIVSEINGITVIDDYAHHPAKIQATLAAARNRFPGKRIIAVWQPHTYSRTKALEEDFIQSFHNADLVVVSEIYASREKIEAYTSETVALQITYTRSKYFRTLPEISKFLLSELKKDDVLIVLSAGDANQICTDVITGLNERSK